MKKDNTHSQIKNQIGMLKRNIEISEKAEFVLFASSLATLATTLVFLPASIFIPRIPINHVNALLEEKGYQEYVSFMINQCKEEFNRGQISEAEFNLYFEHYSKLSGRDFLVETGYKRDLEKFDGYIKQNQVLRYSLFGISTAILTLGIAACGVSMYFDSKLKKYKKDLKELEMLCKPANDNRLSKYPIMEVRFEVVEEERAD